MCLATGLPGLAQNATPRNTAEASTPAGVGSSRAAAVPAGNGSSTGITGVSRYSVGIRGAHSTPAPVTPAQVSVVGYDSDMQPATLHLEQFRSNTLGIRAGTPISVRLEQAVDSGHVRNGQTLHGKLVQAVGNAPAGSPVDLTVVAAATAGHMQSAGEMSLQVIRINGEAALSQVITARGREGEKLSPDAAPERGTEAQISPDNPLTLPAA